MFLHTADLSIVVAGVRSHFYATENMLFRNWRKMKLHIIFWWAINLHTNYRLFYQSTQQQEISAKGAPAGSSESELEKKRKDADELLRGLGLPDPGVVVFTLFSELYILWSTLNLLWIHSIKRRLLCVSWCLLRLNISFCCAACHGCCDKLRILETCLRLIVCNCKEELIKKAIQKTLPSLKFNHFTWKAFCKCKWISL